jgi:hypothetical protein
MPEPEEKLIEEKLRIEKRLKSGAAWFYWIAGLSIINSIILLYGSEWGFIVGLGITQIIDAIGLAVAEEVGVAGKIIALVLDCLVAGIFVVFGVFAMKKYKWSFIVGMILYCLDGLLFLLVMDILSIGFHVFALFCIFGGFKAIDKLREFERPQSPESQLPSEFEVEQL